MPDLLLTLNSGSSSLKLGLYQSGESASARPQLLFKGAADHIGKPGGSLTLTDGGDQSVYCESVQRATQPEAFNHAARKLEDLGGKPGAIGHRIVHGGPHLRQHCPLSPEVLRTLRESVHYAPLHIPPALALIEAATQIYPGVPQFACFDTAFHRTMPPEAITYAVPQHLRAQGVQRYGFHGLSYESIVAALAPRVPQRLAVAHLGNGASLCAIADGCSVDTSMGMTPTGGIPMGTRSGDLDPGVVLFAARNGNLSTDGLETMLNHASGLLGLSESATSAGTSDMRELATAAERGSVDAILAITVFCREIAKTIASYASVLGGLDSLVFTGGIGEHSAHVREQVCQRLAFLNVTLDASQNISHASVISAAASGVTVRVIPADEDGRIATHIQRMAAPPGGI